MVVSYVYITYFLKITSVINAEVHCLFILINAVNDVWQGDITQL